MPGNMKELGLEDGRALVGALLGNTGWLLGEKVVRLLVGLAVGALVARYLGPDRFGELSYALALVGLFAVLANVGLDAVVVREIARRPEARDTILGTAFALKAAGGLVAIAGASVAASFAAQSLGALPSLVLPAALALVLQAFDTVDLWFQSRLRARYAVLARNAAFLAVALVKLALVWLGAPLAAFAWAILLEAVLAAAALAAAYRIDRQRMLAWRVRAACAADLLRQGWPLLLSGFMTSIYMRIDQVMLGALAGAEAVGRYSSAVFLSEVLFVVPVAIVTSAAPILASARESDPARYQAQMERLFRALLAVSFVLALATSLLSGPLVAVVFGEAYRGAASVLAVHAWATVFVALGLGSGQFLVLENLTRIAFQRTAVGAALNIVLNLFWIPEYGAIGCAWATLISYAVASLFLFHTSASRRCLGLMLRALRPFPGARRPA
jgi:PST family polysaccharide transporter